MASIEELKSFEGYCAEAQSRVNGLVVKILERLYSCAGFIAVKHPRGDVVNDQGQHTVRASVWIEQEIAMTAMI